MTDKKQKTLQEFKEMKTIKKPTLKRTENKSVNNIIIEKSDLTIMESKTGTTFAFITVGEFDLLINKIWIHETKTGKISIGIKNNYDYPIYKTNEKVKGADLITYYFGLMEYNKSIETKVEAEKKETETKK